MISGFVKDDVTKVQGLDLARLGIKARRLSQRWVAASTRGCLSGSRVKASMPRLVDVSLSHVPAWETHCSSGGLDAGLRR